MNQTASRDLPDLATRVQVAEYTQTSIPTLARWAQSGVGPKVLRIGRSVRYRREDVLAWLESLSEAG
ncbi:MAG: helix-turn-helix transcriptional regulator [Actinomycetota bacterium]